MIERRKLYMVPINKKWDGKPSLGGRSAPAMLLLGEVEDGAPLGWVRLHPDPEADPVMDGFLNAPGVSFVPVFHDRSEAVAWAAKNEIPATSIVELILPP